MADAIGSYLFLRIDGELQPEQQMGVDITQVGIDGIAFRKTSAKTKSSTLETQTFVTLGATIKTVTDLFAAYVYTLKTVSYRGASYTNVFIHDVELVGAIPVINSLAHFDASGVPLSGSGFIVTHRWTLQQDT